MYYFENEKITTQNTLHLFCVCVILLLGTGLVTLYSASSSFAKLFFSDNAYFVIRQLIYSGIGIILFIIISLINLQWFRKYIFILVIIAALLCVLTLVPGVKVERYGASRWIKLGSFSYQPSEAVKFILPMYLAHLLDKKQGMLDNFKTGILPSVLACGFFFALINLQNNFSTAVFIVFNVMIIFFLAGIKLRYFFAAIAMIVPVSVLLVFTKEHRVRRLVSYVRPEWEPLRAGYQVKVSRDAIVSGGFFGKGIGEGTYKLSTVPEIQSDFIFSSYAEETGYLGILLFFALFACFAFLGYKIAMKCNNIFGKLLAASLTTMIISQVMLNVAVVSGALPATGVPLPFFSAGGSSMLTTLISAGLIANIARNNNTSDADNFNYRRAENGI